jgi:spermidine synthase
VIPRELVASAKVPGHRGELRCYRHDGDFTLWLDRTELMSSRVHESEEMLADVALAARGPRPAPNVLVGGLGMGFTLARILARVDSEAKVTVVELIPEVVTWHQQWFGALCNQPLSDPRVSVRIDDVAAVIAASTAVFDVALLDIDNGPEALVHPSNDRVYALDGLRAARQALRPGGVLAVWSSADSPAFGHRLRQAKFQVTAHHTRARGRKGPRRTIWTALAR